MISDDEIYEEGRMAGSMMGGEKGGQTSVGDRQTPGGTIVSWVRCSGCCGGMESECEVDGLDFLGCAAGSGLLVGKKVVLFVYTTTGEEMVGMGGLQTDDVDKSLPIIEAAILFLFTPSLHDHLY